MIDLFASDRNHQLPTFCTWLPSERALAVDAFSIDWTGMIAYAYPPICLIPRLLLQMRHQHCRVLLIAPMWPRRTWFPDLLRLLTNCPLVLPERADLLRQPKGQFYHPAPGILRLSAWPLSSWPGEHQAFLEELNVWWRQPSAQVRGRTISPNMVYSEIGVVNKTSIPALFL